MDALKDCQIFESTPGQGPTTDPFQLKYFCLKYFDQVTTKCYLKMKTLFVEVLLDHFIIMARSRTQRLTHRHKLRRLFANFRVREDKIV